MALVLADRIKETTTTTGTGTYTLAGAVAGFEPFTTIGNGNTTYYACTLGSDFEVGIGTYTASGTTLARTTILQSSNNDNAVDWGAGEKTIFCTQPAEKAVFLNASDNIELADNKKIILGTGSDLAIFHDGSNSAIIDQGTGGLFIRGTAINIDDSSSNDYITATEGGAVTLFHNGSARLITTSTGAKVTGGTGDGTLIIESDTDNSGESDNALLQLTQDGGLSVGEFGFDSSNALFIKNTLTGAVGNVQFMNGTEILAKGIGGGAFELYHDNSKKLETTSSGVEVTGTVTDDGATHDGDMTLIGGSGSNAVWSKSSAVLNFLDNAKLSFGTGNDLRIWHSGTNSFLRDEGTGVLFVDTNGTGIHFRKDSSETMAKMLTDGAVELYHDNSKKLETTSSGATVTGELAATSLDISGDVDVDGTLEADAMTLNGTAITSTATLSTGISNNNVPKFTSGVADNDFLRVDGTSIEGRSASEVLSDIGGQASLTFGISNTNAVKIDSTSVADDEYARFTANGLESRSTSEVLSDIGGISASSTDTLTNKTLTTPVINGFSGTGDGSLTGDLTLTATDDSSNSTPELKLVRHSASPADFDYIGGLSFFADNSADQNIEFGTLEARIRDVTDGTEDFAGFELFGIKNGTARQRFMILGQEIFHLMNQQSIRFDDITSTHDLIFSPPSSLSTSQTITLPDATGTVSLLTNTETLTNKTLTNPTINAFSGTGDASITGDLTLTSTDAGSSSDPTLKFFRNSASPADNDALGKFTFNGNNSAAEEVQYAAIVSRLTDATDGTEDGTFELQTISGGTNKTNVRIDASSTVGIRLVNGGEKNIRFDTGTAFDGNHIDLTPASATGARTVTLPDATGTVLLTDGDGSSLTNVNATTLDSVDSTSFLRSDAADTKTSGNLQFSDNVRLRLGSSGSSDLQIWHDGTNSNIVNGTGDLIIGDSTGDVKIQGKYGEQSIIANNDGSVELYHDNSKKLETTSTGATVTGTAKATVKFETDDVTVGFTSNGATSGSGNFGVASSNGGARINADSGSNSSTFIDFDATNISASGGDITYRFGRGTTEGSSDLSELIFYAHDGTNNPVIRLKSTGELVASSLDISGNVDVDGTLEADAITLNGTSLAASATTDTTNASNIGSGTLPNARLASSVLTTSNSDAPTTTTSSSDADFVLIDDGGTMKKITPSNLGITGGGTTAAFATAMAMVL